MSGTAAAQAALDRAHEARLRARDAGYRDVVRAWEQYQVGKTINTEFVVKNVIPRLLASHGVGDGPDRAAYLGLMLGSSEKKDLDWIFFELYWIV